MSKPLILVTGSRGQVGSELAKLSSDIPRFDFLYIDKDDVDLGDKVAFSDYTEGKKINYIINCAAYTAVDQAESDEANALLINAKVPGMLAEFCQTSNTRLLHISTDYVFEGNGNVPLTELNQPNPSSVYGKTKLQGEKEILDKLNNAYIFRTAWVYSVFGKNFLKTMLSLAKTRAQVSVVYDQVGTPTNARDLAWMILTVIENIELGNDFPGVYHYTNEGVTSWFDFATAIFKIADLPTDVAPIPTSDYRTAAKRPVFSVLDKTKIKKTFNISIPHWMESLEKTINELKQ